MDSADTRSTFPSTDQLPSLGRPSRLGIAGPPGVDIDSLIQQLRQAGLQGTAEAQEGMTGYDLVKYTTPADLSAWLKKHGGAHILLCWQAPVSVLSQAMASGSTPEDALDAWVERNEALLAVIRQHRRRFTLVEMTLAEVNTAQLANRLNQRLSLALATPTAAPQVAPSQEDPVHALIAHRAVIGNTRAKKLAAELQVTSVPVGLEETLLPEAVVAWQAYNEAMEQRQREIERFKQKCQQLEAQRNTVLEPDPDLESAKHKLESLNKDLQEENDLLLQQLHHVQEELEAYYLKSIEAKQGSKQVSKLKRQNALLQRRVDYMENSRSWKITRPMRRMIGRLKGKKKTSLKKQVNQNG